MPRKIPQFVQKQVRKRAEYFCEYCRADEHWQFVPFTIDHIVPISQGGTNSPENPALACFHCNRHKSDKQFVNGIPVFIPRKMSWNNYFSWSKDRLRILPKTDIGKVTIDLLRLNRERLLLIRAEEIQINRHPPENDSIEN